MHNRLDVKDCLKVFNTTLTKGTQSGHCFEYQGFKAWSDFDGYTCFLQYHSVTMTLMFHGKYEIDSPSNDALDEFEKQITRFIH